MFHQGTHHNDTSLGRCHRQPLGTSFARCRMRTPHCCRRSDWRLLFRGTCDIDESQWLGLVLVCDVVADTQHIFAKSLVRCNVDRPLFGRSHQLQILRRERTCRRNHKAIACHTFSCDCSASPILLLNAGTLVRPLQVRSHSLLRSSVDRSQHRTLQTGTYEDIAVLAALLVERGLTRKLASAAAYVTSQESLGQRV